MQRSTWRLVLGALLTSHIVLALFPFRFDPPRPVTNDVTRTDSGSLVFGEHNRARSHGRPAWVDMAALGSSVRVSLSVRTHDVGQTGPARILSLARGPDQAALTIAQDAADIVVRVRRPGSLPDGRPPLVVRDVLSGDRWTDVVVHIHGRAVQVDAANQTRRVVAPGAVTSTWDDQRTRVALGSEPQGSKPWRGEVRAADILVGDHTHDLLSEQVLETPTRYWYIPDRGWQDPAPQSLTSVAVHALRALSFAPVGGAVVLTLRRHSPRTATVVVVALAVSLTLSKWLVESRHPSWADVAVQSAGGVMGIAVALASRRHRPRQGRP